MAKRITAAALAAHPETAKPQAVPPGAMGPNVVHLSPTLLRQDPRNARTIQPSEEDTARLIGSVREVGVVMPILVTPGDDGTYGVLAGWQRAKAAIAAERNWVPAIVVRQEDGGAARLSLLENTLRTAMHPLDQWRSVDTLMQAGATLAAAADALGMTGREASKMRLLAALHPDLLAEMQAGEVPAEWLLRDIARASPERQVEALNAGRVREGKGHRIVWQTVAGACRVTRIPRAFAIFPHKGSGVEFERDFFAEAGHTSEWTTTNVEGFLAAQRAALEKLIEGHPQALVADWSEAGFGPAVPKGWTAVKWFDAFPKAIPEMAEDGRFVVSMKPTGEVVARQFRVPREAAQSPDQDAPPPPPAPPRLINDAGLQMAAEMKQQALRDAMEHFRDTIELGKNRPAILLRALLQALSAQNVTPGAADKYAALEAIADATPGGGEPSEGELVRIATTTLADMLVFPAPKVISSGDIANEIARSLGAADHLPRFDTPEFLAQCSGALLRQAAQLVQRQPGQKVPTGVAALRDYISGKLPDWRPVDFGKDEPDNE